MDARNEQGAVAEGLATIGAGGKVLDSWFPRPRLESGVAASATERLSQHEAVATLGSDVAECLGRESRRDVEVVAIRTRVPSLGQAPADVHDVYLRLHLLSHRLVKPHGVDLAGMFGLLNIVA